MSEHDAPERGRIRFGPLPNQDVPADWADALLTVFATKYRRQFGAALLDAALPGDAPEQAEE